LPQLRNAQAQRTQPRLEGAIAVSIPIIEPLGAALVPTGPDQTLDIGFH
jgi:hypothetical protein